MDLEIVVEAENAGHKVAGLADDPWHGLAQKNFRSSLRPLNPYICIASISALVIGAGAHEPRVTSALPWDSTTNVKSCVVGERNAY